MSADWPVQATESWKASLPCSRAEAEAILRLDEPLGAHGGDAVLIVSETDPATPDAWRIDVYSEGAPTPALIACLRTLAPSTGDAPVVERLEDADWVRISQSFLEPVRAGRFLVHTAAHAAAVPPGVVAFRIEASRAFGTGHHETTAGCLALLDRLAAAGRRFTAIADVGTGTGLLALAAHALWPEAAVLASDIDPVAIEVARGNLIANGVARDAVTLVVADGVAAPAIAAAAPFDLVVANILAAPLIALAPAVGEVVAPGGVVVLAGLLDKQERMVADAYAAAGFAPLEQLARGGWPVLAMTR